MENSEQNKRKYTSEDLKRLQSLTLDEKIQLSKARIIEFAEKMDNKIYVYRDSTLR